MPFHDQEWEDLQRDCDIFPAYTDYVYGPDRRLIVAQEPGLHPAIYHIDTSAPVRYTNSMPSRSWSYRTAEGLEKSNAAAMGEWQTEYNESGDADMSNTSSCSSTPGLDIRSRMGSPLYPLLPPQGVRTVSKKQTAQRRISNASQRQPQSGTPVQFSPSQQQQSMRVTRQQTRTNNAPIVHKSGSQPTQLPLLRSSSTTDIDENLAQKAAVYKPAPILPPPMNLHQQQSQRATDLTSDVSHTPASNTLVDPSKQIILLRPNDVLHDPRYNCLHPDKRREIATLLLENGLVARDSQDGALRANALTNIQNVTMLVNQWIPSAQATTELQNQMVQQLPTQEALQAQARQIHQSQMPQHQHQPQPQPQAPRVYAPPQLQPGISPLQSSQPSPNPYHSVLHTPQQQMSPPQPTTAQGYQASFHQNANPIPTTPQLSAQLRANIDRHLPQVWQCVHIIRVTPESCSEEAAQNKVRAEQWLEQFKTIVPIEGHSYLMQAVSKMVREDNQRMSAAASSGLQAGSV